jgi:hypothetical protein
LVTLQLPLYSLAQLERNKNQRLLVTMSHLALAKRYLISQNISDKPNIELNITGKLPEPER